jgi:hypothetical protein
MVSQQKCRRQRRTLILRMDVSFRASVMQAFANRFFVAGIAQFTGFNRLGETRIPQAFVAPVFRRVLWSQAHARLKAGAT